MMRNWTPLGFAHAPEQDAGGSDEVPAPAVDELLVRILACIRVCALHTYIPMYEYIHTHISAIQGRTGSDTAGPD